MNQNKVYYLLKLAKVIKEWKHNFNLAFKYTIKLSIDDIKCNETLEYQIPLSQRMGGFDMRSHEVNFSESKMSSMLRKTQGIKVFVRFKIVNGDYNNMRKTPY